MTSLPRFTITQLNSDPGYWQARVSINGDSVGVDRKHGSWQAIVRDGPRLRSFHRTEVHPQLAAKLQEKVRPLEKKLEVKR